MLIDPLKATLLVVDIQEKLIGARSDPEAGPEAEGDVTASIGPALRSTAQAALRQVARLDQARPRGAAGQVRCALGRGGGVFCY